MPALVPPSEKMKWYYSNDGQTVEGPTTVEVMEELHKRGVLSREAWVAREGSDEWVPFSQFSVAWSDRAEIDADSSEPSGCRDAKTFALPGRRVHEPAGFEQGLPHVPASRVAAKNMPSRKLVAWVAGGAVLAVVVLTATITRSGLGSKEASLTKEASSLAPEPDAATGLYVGASFDKFCEVLGKQNITKSFRFEGRKKAAFTYLIFDESRSDLIAIGIDDTDVSRVVVYMRRNERGGNVALDEESITGLLLRFSRSGKAWVRMEESSSGADSAWADMSSISRRGGVMANYDSESRSLTLGAPKDIERAYEDLSHARVEDLSNIEVKNPEP